LEPFLVAGAGCFIDSTVDSVMAAEHKGVVATATAICSRAGSLVNIAVTVGECNGTDQT